MLARAEAEKRNEEAMLAGKPVTLGTAADEGTRVSDHTRGSLGEPLCSQQAVCSLWAAVLIRMPVVGWNGALLPRHKLCAIGRLTYTTCF